MARDATPQDLILICWSAPGSPTSAGKPKYFERLANGSLSEARTGAADPFAELELPAEPDFTLDPEYDEERRRRLRSLQAVDWDGDGDVSLVEFTLKGGCRG